MAKSRRSKRELRTDAVWRRSSRSNWRGAQRRYSLAQARTAQHDAKYGLLTAMDLPPTAQLRIIDVSSRPRPKPLEGTLPQSLNAALHRRPDLIATVARLRASDEGIAEARSALLPKLSLSTNIQGNLGRISVNGLPYEGVKEPQGASSLTSNGRSIRAGCCGSPRSKQKLRNTTPRQRSIWRCRRSRPWPRI
jgi:hypothetical protein